jgi:hypothetical protein
MTTLHPGKCKWSTLHTYTTRSTENTQTMLPDTPRPQFEINPLEWTELTQCKAWDTPMTKSMLGKQYHTMVTTNVQTSLGHEALEVLSSSSDVEWLEESLPEKYTWVTCNCHRSPSSRLVGPARSFCVYGLAVLHYLNHWSWSSLWWSKGAGRCSSREHGCKCLWERQLGVFQFGTCKNDSRVGWDKSTTTVTPF